MKTNNLISVSVRQLQYADKAVLLSGSDKTVQEDRQDEIARLKSEIQRLTIERNLLRKTAVYFSRRL